MTEGKSPINNGLATRGRAARSRLLRRILILLALTVAVVPLVLLMRGQMNRSERMRLLERVDSWLRSYQQQYGSYPRALSPDAVVGRRFGISITTYRRPAPDTPDDAIIVYTSRAYGGLFLPRGHAVLRKNGRVEWLDSEQLQHELRAADRAGSRNERGSTGP